ncbi:hypothetical protein D6779_00915, partial [Candidatus Parcubacteria bacterium]
STSNTWVLYRRYGYNGVEYDINSTAYYVDPSSTSIFNDLRANIFYDRQNTGYYVDPNSTTNMYQVYHQYRTIMNGTTYQYNYAYATGYWGYVRYDYNVYSGYWKYNDYGYYGSYSNGYAMFRSYYYYSSKRYKEILESLGGNAEEKALSDIMGAQAVRFRYKSGGAAHTPDRSGAPPKVPESLGGVSDPFIHYGLVAESLPDYVKDDSGVRIDVGAMNALLVNAIKALNRKVDALGVASGTGFYVDPQGTSRLNGVRADHLYYAGEEGEAQVGLAEIRSGDLSGVMDPSRRFIDARAMDGMLLSGIRALDAKVSDLGSQVHDLAGLVDSLFAQKQG